MMHYSITTIIFYLYVIRRRLDRRSFDRLFVIGGLLEGRNLSCFQDAQENFGEHVTCTRSGSVCIVLLQFQDYPPLISAHQSQRTLARSAKKQIYLQEDRELLHWGEVVLGRPGNSYSQTEP